MWIISKITDGLGNQMFQYATGFALARRLNAEFYIDKSWFDRKVGKGKIKRSFALDKFPELSLKLATPEMCQKLGYTPPPQGLAKLVNKILKKKNKPRVSSYVGEPSFQFWPGFLDLKSDTYLEGFWQSEQYFVSVKTEIQKEFTFPKFTTLKALGVAEKIESAANAVCVHIRRGDYVTSKSASIKHGTVQESYYDTALAEILNNVPDAELFFFSDDIPWVKETFQQYQTIACFVDIPEHVATPWQDMHLMSLCKHHIIANSSFSWWGAWLALKEGEKIAPRIWFKREDYREYNPCPAYWSLF